MQKFILFVLALLLPTGAHAAIGDHLWSQGWTAGGMASPDGTGHVAAAGAFYSTLDLGGTLYSGQSLGRRRLRGAFRCRR